MRPVGSEEVVAHFAYGAESAKAGRRLVSTTLEAWGRHDLEEIATLLVSELIANAVLHAGTGLDLHIRRRGERVRIEVHDGSPRLPVRKHHSATATTGRGLMLVERLSRAWGARPAGAGKAVWFELDQVRPGALVEAAFELEDWPDLEDGGPMGPPLRPAPPVDYGSGRRAYPGGHDRPRTTGRRSSGWRAGSARPVLDERRARLRRPRSRTASAASRRPH